MKYLKQLYYFLIFNNIMIACAAVAQCVLTYIILGQETNVHIVLIEGSSTLLLYNFSLYLSRPANPAASPYRRTRWVFGHMYWFWLWSILAVLMMAYALFHVHVWTWVYLSFIGVVSMLYSMPIFRLQGKRTGLRQLPGVKLFYIALLWSLSSVGLPVIELWTGGVSVDWWVANYLGLLKILFLMICTLPFDIRDMNQDMHYQLRTIPTMIGERRAKLVCYNMILLHTILVLLVPYDPAVKCGLVLTNMGILSVLYFLVFRRLGQYHGVYLLDLALIGQCVATYVMVVWWGV